MLKYIAAVSFLAVLLLQGAPAAFAADGDAVATILTIEGSATVTPAGSKDAVAAKANMRIHMHDVIQTKKQSRLFLLFIDNTQITLADSTRLTVDEYVFDPDNKAGNKARYNILEGTFDYLSGLVAKKKDPDVQIKTAYGSIGIRGTQLWGGHVTGHGYGIYVSEGAIGVSNSGGGVNVGAGQGTFILGPGQPPGPPGPWNADELALLSGSQFNGGHLHDHKGDQNQLLLEWLKHHRHHHGEQGDNDIRMKDLPQDETGEPDFVPFVPGGIGGCGNNC